MSGQDAAVHRQVILALVHHQGPGAHRYVTKGQEAAYAIQETAQ